MTSANQINLEPKQGSSSPVAKHNFDDDEIAEEEDQAKVDMAKRLIGDEDQNNEYIFNPVLYTR